MSYIPLSYVYFKLNYFVWIARVISIAIIPLLLSYNIGTINKI